MVNNFVYIEKKKS